ncbi:hypothetical protein HDU83_000679 [Entophlyctis luteolus]|nr:hypothetical protein HDU83_000679 [Entophlyctis luteolus]
MDCADISSAAKIYSLNKWNVQDQIKAVSQEISTVVDEQEASLQQDKDRPLQAQLEQKQTCKSDPKLLRTTHELLETVFEPVRQAVFHSSTATTSTEEDFPLSSPILSEWPDFEANAMELTKEIPNLRLVTPVFAARNRLCSDEAAVTALADWLLFDSLEILFKSLCPAFEDLNEGNFMPSTHDPRVFGNPDRTWSTKGHKLTKLTIEFKAPWTFGHVSNLIAAYSKECKKLGESKIMGKGKVTRAVEQVNGYMTLNGHRYGVLTTLNQTWFLRKTEDEQKPNTPHLQVSPAIQNVASSPSLTLMKAWTALLLSIERNSDWLYLSPDCRIGFAAPPVKPKPIPEHQQKYQSVKMDGILDWQDIIGRSQAGAVASGRFRDLDGVVFKTIDTLKKRDGLAQFQKEVEIYQHLEEFQGSVIPKFIAFGHWFGFIQVIVLENVGRQISYKEFMERREEVEDVVKMIHSKDVEHGDLRLPNIMIDDRNKIRLIDFGMSSIVSDGEIQDYFEVYEHEKESSLME